MHSPVFLLVQCSGASDLPSLALKASRYGLCASFGVSVCPRPFQISSWAPSLNGGTAGRCNKRDGDWTAETTRPLAIPRAPIDTKSKQKHVNNRFSSQISRLFKSEFGKICCDVV